MRAVDASGTCTVPFEVDRDRIPRRGVVLVDRPVHPQRRRRRRRARDSAASACADALAPETIAADINRTESPFLMTASCWRRTGRLYAASNGVPTGKLRGLQSDKRLDLQRVTLTPITQRPTWMTLHIRPTVAKWLQDLSLGTRLSFLSGSSCSGWSRASRTWKCGRTRTTSTATSSIRRGWRRDRPPTTLAERPLPLDPLDIRDSLHDLIEADPVVDCDLGHRGRRDRTPARVHEHVNGRTRRRSWTSPDGPSPRRRSPALRSSTLVMFALPVPRRGTLRRGGHRRPGEPAPGAHARTSRRPRVRRADHRARDASSSTSPSAGSWASRSTPFWAS